jgi:signal transduction histidine kinase
MKLRGFSEKGLRLTLGGFLLALLIPTLTLVLQAYRQLERDTFFQYRTAAEELARRIDEQLAASVLIEDQREFSDYGFLVVAGEDFVQRSPLSGFPVVSPIPGARSYFQVDTDGNLSTPLLPERQTDSSGFGVTSDEYEQRLGLQNQVLELLNQPYRGDEPEAVFERKTKQDIKEEDHAAPASAAASAPAPAPTSAPTPAPMDSEYRGYKRLNNQEVLDRLEESSRSKVSSQLGRVADLGLNDNVAPSLESEPVAKLKIKKQRSRRLEQNVAPAREQAELQTPATVNLESFTSEVEPFRFAILDEQNFVLYRTVWREQARYIQGLVFARDDFLRATIGRIFASAAIADQTNLMVAYEGELLRAFNTRSSSYFSSAAQITGTLLHQARMSPPFNDLTLIFSAERLPVSAGRAFVMWTAAILVGVLFGGFWFMYRMGLRQITLNNQQQDFVSAISHELKTPLTSIRMYGEILKAGWASEDKKRSYYDFIFQESERLSRLINNVLQLARLTRNTTELELKSISVGELADVVRSKVSSQIEQAQFELREDHQDTSAMLLADTDAFSQIMINLVDNAIKFSTDDDLRRVEISSRVGRNNSLEFSVRDYGPGVPKDQMRKIFELFYRTERELTRETVGTGIGLALVHELVSSMGGTIKARNMNPGVEFRMEFPGYDGDNR